MKSFLLVFLLLHLFTPQVVRIAGPGGGGCSTLAWIPLTNPQWTTLSNCQWTSMINGLSWTALTNGQWTGMSNTEWKTMKN